jgi:hypothetical protein
VAQGDQREPLPDLDVGVEGLALLLQALPIGIQVGRDGVDCVLEGTELEKLDFALVCQHRLAGALTDELGCLLRCHVKV